MRHGNDRRRPAGDPTQHAGQRSAYDTDQDRTVDLPPHQDQSQYETEAGRLHFMVSKASQTDEGRRIGNHEFRISQAHKRDEEANSRCGGML